MKSSTAVRTAMIAAAVLVTACQDATAPEEPLTAQLARGAITRQDYMEAAFRRATPEVMALAGTVFADNDERIGKLVFGIENASAARGVEMALARLGIPRSDYAVEVTQPIRQMTTLRDVFRPTRSGIQIHFTNYLCTLGFNVDHDGGRSFITNSHCTATQGGTEGTVYYQSSSSLDPTVVATEVDDPEYFRSGCSRGKICRYSDAARALYSSSVASNRGEIAKPTGVNIGSLTVASINGVDQYFTITSQDNSSSRFLTSTGGGVGVVVNKVGRTTGWTRGTVTRTCVNTAVSGSRVMQLCQTFVSDPNGASVVGSGDSGSGVFTTTDDSNAELVGILWGGSSDNKTFIFSPLASIQKELGSFNAIR